MNSITIVIFLLLFVFGFLEMIIYHSLAEKIANLDKLFDIKNSTLSLSYEAFKKGNEFTAYISPEMFRKQKILKRIRLALAALLILSGMFL